MLRWFIGEMEGRDALQDATRIAINHFHVTKTKDGDEFEMHCSRITARWAGTLYNKLGG